MITIVIPVYNAATYIHHCISGLESQTRKDFKVVFIDDGSKDDSVAVLEEIKANSPLDITILQNDENKGPAYSRNKGITYTQSDFITFCDCDDWYDPRFIELMGGLIEETQADIVFCGYNVLNEGGLKEQRPIRLNSGIVAKDKIFELDVDSLCMMMTKTSLMKETLLPDLRNGEDVAAVSLLLAKAQVVAVSNRCLYNYSRRRGSASETISMNTIDSLIKSFEYIKHEFPEEKNSELEYLGVKNMLYASMVSLFTICYDTAAANRILDQFEADFPNWRNNKYIKKLTWYKRLILNLLRHRLFFLIRSIALVRMRFAK